MWLRKRGIQSFGGGTELHILGILYFLERRTDFPSNLVLGEQLAGVECSNGRTDVVVVLLSV